jgi:signal peptidase I
MNPTMERWFCRIYLLLLYTYPKPFRARFGGEMQQVFRDRCRHIARSRLSVLAFALRTASDWLSTVFRERLSAIDLRAIWKAGRKSTPRGFVVEWALTIITFLFFTTTMVQAYVIPTASMEGNLRIGDHVLVDRVAYADPGPFKHVLPYHDIARGDIVVFFYPEDIRQNYVKRVIGLPGDRIHLSDKQVIRNGLRLIEPYTQHISDWHDPYRDDFPTAPNLYTTPRGRDMFANHVRDGELVVPPGFLFCLGDNRENSEDSRYWGLVPREYVVGKPLVVYWSYDAPTSDLIDWNLNHLVDLAQHFFTRTRWDRMFLVPRSQSAQTAVNTTGVTQ